MRPVWSTARRNALSAVTASRARLAPPTRSVTLVTKSGPAFLLSADEFAQLPKLADAPTALAPHEADLPIAAFVHRVQPDPRVLQERAAAGHLGQKGDAEVGIDHFHERQQAAGREAGHFLGVADATGGERVIPQAVTVFEQQDRLGLQTIEPIVARVDGLRALAHGEAETVTEQGHGLGAAELVGQGEQNEVKLAIE